MTGILAQFEGGTLDGKRRRLDEFRKIYEHCTEYPGSFLESYKFRARILDRSRYSEDLYVFEVQEEEPCRH